MNIRDLEYLVAVANYRQFAKAASACNVSQPSLSIQIKKLEEELGVVIFERTNKQIFVTNIGENIIAKAQSILREIKEMRDLSKIASNQFAGEFKLGLIATVAPYLLPDLLPMFKKTFPQLQVCVTESQTDLLMNELQKGSIDAAILALPVQDSNLESAVIYEEPFYLAVPYNHKLAAKNRVSKHDLLNQELFLLDDGHCLRDQALEICSNKNTKEQTNFRASSLETLRHVVAGGLGITLMPKRAIKNDDKITYIPFVEKNFKRTIGLVWRKSSPRKSLLKDIITSFKNPS